MIYNEFCGEKISRLGFGAMRFPNDRKEIKKMIDEAYYNGVNYFDTAYVYENSEVELGNVLKDYKRDTFFVTSKLPAWRINKNKSADDLFNESLERLKVDYIDYYLIHSIDEESIELVKKYDLVNFCLNLKKEGKIKHLGFSIHADMKVLKEMLSLTNQFEFVQIQLNYLDYISEPGFEGYEYLTSKNIPVVVMEPLKGGTLSILPDEIAKPFINLKKDYSYSSYAFKWVMENENVKVILSGMSDSLQVKDNLKTFSVENKLTIKEKEAIEEVKNNIINHQKVPCTGCRYCMPCKQGVDIPGCFKAWNTKSMNTSNWISGTNLPEKGTPDKCIECGACMKHCPQHINIIEKLKEVRKEYNI